MRSERLKSLLARLDWLMTRDHVPWLNRYVYWLKTPLGVLLATAALAGVCGWWISAQAFVLMAALLAVLALGMLWPWLVMRGIACELRFGQSRTTEGRVVNVTFVVRNRWPWPIWGLSIEGGLAPRDDTRDATSVSLARVPSWSRVEFQWAYRPSCRGRFPMSPTYIATEFPLGLWRSRAVVGLANHLTVWPRTVNLGRAGAAVGTRRSLANPSDSRAGHEGDRRGVRPFRPGDSPRCVHWNLTAKLDRLIVSERQESARSNATVRVKAEEFVEAHARGGDFDPRSRWEWALRVASSVCLSFLNENTETRLIVGRRTIVVPPNSVGRRRLLDFVASLDPRASDGDDRPPRRETKAVPPRENVVVGAVRGDAASLAVGRENAPRGIVVLGDSPADDAHEPSRPRNVLWLRTTHESDPLAQLKLGWKTWEEESWRGKR